jgi:hypothetical protein
VTPLPGASRGVDSVRVNEPGGDLLDPAWLRCPLRACAHGMLLHDGDGVGEDWICCADGCSCRGSFDDLARLVAFGGR